MADIRRLEVLQLVVAMRTRSLSRGTQSRTLCCKDCWGASGCRLLRQAHEVECLFMASENGELNEINKPRYR